jgi:hypothetical protein
VRLGWISAIALGATFGMWTQSCEPPEATEICAKGYVLSTGVLSAAVHEANEGYFTVGRHLVEGSTEPLTSLFLNPKNPSVHHARALLGRVVSLCVVPYAPREQQRIER